MAVDFLRSTHRQRVRAVDGSGRQFKIRWFFCDNNALILPFPTAFGSLVWEVEDFPVGPIGQVDREIYWDNGRNRGYTGQCWSGDPQWFLDGIPADQVEEPAPLMCCLPGMQQLGGAGAGGDAYVTTDYCLMEQQSPQADILTQQGAGCIEVQH